MNTSPFYNCPSCGAVNASVLEEPSLIVCKQCHEIVFENVGGYAKPKPAKVREDWSFLQVGTGAEYNKNPLSIIGRVRLELRNDYKNFWCGALKNGKHIWIMESFASFCILGSSWDPFQQSLEQLHAGSTVNLRRELTLTGEYVEKCEGVSYEGEIGSWKLFYPGFYFIQCSNKNDNTAVFFVDGRDNIEYLTGGKTDPKKLNLNNILAWDEWK